MLFTISYQVCQILDCQVDALFSGSVQGFLQESSYRPELQYLGSTQHIYQQSYVPSFVTNTELWANPVLVYSYCCLQAVCDKTTNTVQS